MALYTGADCGNLTLVACDDNSSPNGAMPEILAGGLTPGSTVWVRIWPKGGILNASGTFGICVTIPPPPPVNDDPCNAITLTADSTCHYTTYTNQSATNSIGVPAPGCASYQGGDVWFQVTVPSGGSLNFDTQAGTMINGGMAIYSGNCGALTLIACDDNSSSNTSMPYIAANNLTPGSTIYVQMWADSNLNNGTFGICVSIPLPEPTTFSFHCPRDTAVACSSSCFNLTAIIPNIHAQSTSYNVNSISSAGCFSPYVNPGIPGAATSLNVDDVYSSVINLPFTFPFYGSPFTKICASTNGYITFDSSRATLFSHWNIINGGVPQDLPSTFYDKALIMGPYHDLDPFYTTSPSEKIKFNVTGVAPHRRWILSFYKVPLFLAGTCDTLIQNTHQIVLYEATGIVEVFIFDVRNCPGWNQGRAMIGMQNMARNAAIMAPGRKASDNPWGAIGMDESWRFIPSAGPSLLKRVELFDLNGNLVRVGDTTSIDATNLHVNFPNICPTQGGDIKYVVKSTYYKFDDPNVEIYGTDTITVHRSANLSALVSVTPIKCNGDSATLTINVNSGTAPFHYSVDGGVTMQDNNQFTLAAGSYNIHITDSSNCAKDTSITITQPALLTGQYVATNVLCHGGNNGSIVVTAAGGTAPYQYSIDGGTTYQSANIFTTLPAGTYPVTIKDTNNCRKDTTIILSEPASITGSYLISNVLCNGGSSGAISVQASGGTTPYQFSIDGGALQSSPDFTGLVAGPHLVSIIDFNNCRLDSSLIITEPTVLTGSYVVKNVLCHGGATGSIAITAAGGTSSYQYSIDNGTTYQDGNTFNGLTIGTYAVTIKDNNGCRKDTSITITEPASINGTYAVVNVKCNGGNGSITVTATGGVAPYQYSSDGGNTYQSGNSFTLAAGNYTISIKDSNSCRFDSLITITQPLALAATNVTVNSTCSVDPNGQINVTATGGTSPYTYSNGGVNFQSSNSFVVNPGTYTITVKDSNSCVTTTSAVVGLNFNLTIQGRQDTTICGNVAVQLNTTSNATNYSWSPSTGLSDPSVASPVATPTTTTTYVLTAQTGPCTIKDTVTVNVVPLPTVNAGNGVSIVLGGDAQLSGTVNNAASFVWSPSTYLSATDVLNPVSVRPQQTITYVLTATNSAGCSDTSSVVVTVIPYCVNVKSAFTPNGDGINDYWSVYDQSGCFSTITAQVFNRYGSLVYESQDYHNNWYGTYNGQSLPDGTYYYLVTVHFNNGITQQFRGDVTILR